MQKNKKSIVSKRLKMVIIALTLVALLTVGVSSLLKNTSTEPARIPTAQGIITLQAPVQETETNDNAIPSYYEETWLKQFMFHYSYLTPAANSSLYTTTAEQQCDWMYQYNETIEVDEEIINKCRFQNKDYWTFEQQYRNFFFENFFESTIETLNEANIKLTLVPISTWVELEELPGGYEITNGGFASCGGLFTDKKLVVLNMVLNGELQVISTHALTVCTFNVEMHHLTFKLNPT